MRNRTAGEAAAVLRGDELNPEVGFYVRRQQSAEIGLPGALDAGPHSVTLELGLAGVSSTTISGDIVFA